MVKKIACYVQGYEGYGYFIGCLLSQQTGNLNQIKKSLEFYNLLTLEIENFFKSYAYSKQNVEKYFNRFVFYFFWCENIMIKILGQLVCSNITV